MPYTFKHGDRPLDDYTIQRAVGSGGFGEVYYAISDGGREVALKYLRSNPDIELRGVSHCINLKSPHLVSIFDVKKDANGEYFVIMEYCSGPSLSDLLIAEPNGFGPQKAAFFVREIAKGLSYLHDRGIVHRDLKPANLFFDDGYVKIGDYGLSKFISISRHSAQTSSIGTVHYMAPEIGSGNYSRGVDIYALGVMLYEMLLGRVPFEGSTMAEVLMKHLTVQPAVENLPEPFGKVIRKALEKDPKVRYQTVNEMMDDLLDVAEVRDSLAGFSTQSLMGAVRQGSPGRGRTPMPSPNPPPKLRGYGVDVRGDVYAGGSAEDLSKRVGKKFNRISRKVERKMAKLGGRKPVDAPPPIPNEQPRLAQITGPDRRRQMLLSLLISAGISAVMALIIGNASDAPVMGVSALLMIPAMAGGIGLSRYAIVWFAAEQGPSWAVRALRGVCCAFPIAIGAIPLLAGAGGTRNGTRFHEIASMAMDRVNVAQVTNLSVDLNQIGLGLLIALTVMAMLGNWERTLLDSPNGELRIGSAIPRTFGALIIGMITAGIMDIRDEGYVGFPVAGIVAAVTLIIQINGWWINAVKGMPQPVAVETNGHRVRAEARHAWRSRKQTRQANYNEADCDVDEEGHDYTATNVTSKPIDPNAPLLRSGIIRAFWALIAFCLTSGIIVQSLVLSMISNLDADERDGLVIGIVSCAIVLVFLAIRKTSPIRRPGFWLETVRPLIMTGMAAAVGVNTTILIREAFGIQGDDYARMGVAGGAICSSLALVAFSLFAGRKKKLPKPFITIGSRDGAVIAAGVISADAKEAVADVVAGAVRVGESVLDTLDAIDSPNTGQTKPDDKK